MENYRILFLLIIWGMNATYVSAAEQRNCSDPFITQRGAADEITFFPSKKNPTEAEKLKAKGFGAAYYRGIDKVYEWIALRKYMRNHLLSADSKKLSELHSDYFGEEIRAHIGYMENQAKTEGQRDNLKLLKAYAEDKIRERKFSYRELLKGSLLLANMFSSDEPVSLVLSWVDDTVNQIINEFPYKLLMPTTAGEVGFIAINRALGENIHIGGLVAEYKFIDVSPSEFTQRDEYYVSGLTDEYPINEDEPPEKESPWIFFSHDVDHMIRSGRISKPIHNELLKIMEGLSVKDRKKAEKAYWDFIHENSEDLAPKSLGTLMTPVLVELSNVELGILPEERDESIFNPFSFSPAADNTPKEIAESFVQWALSSSE